MVNSKLKLILASASPRRKELLGHLKLPFEILTLNVPEESDLSDPAGFSLEIAKCKGQAVMDHLLKVRPSENFMVVSADTIVSMGNRIYGKPRDRDEARQFLSELAGKTHSVFTAVSVMLIFNGNHSEFSFVDESRVTFDKIAPDVMEKYLDTGDSLDKAGAYGIQGPSLTFISKVEGSYSNVVGFPLSRFIEETQKFLKDKFPQEPSWFKLF
ncbi:MAG TPA: Maf family protein [Bacteriovoracaceae bacterium]|nr:Maf family protein [Bacteriovoracaceae bacterium]